MNRTTNHSLLGLSLAVATLVATATVPAQAAIETQVIPINHTEGLGFPFFTVNYFDDMGGSRTLTGVSLELDITSTLEVFTENTGTQPINNWNFDFGVWPALEILDFEELSFPFTPADYPTVLLNLDASDGVPGSGPDFAHIPPRNLDIIETIVVNPGDVPLFNGVGSVDAFMGLPFIFGFPPGPTDTSWLRSETGTLSIHYQYVPEPTSVALLSLGGAVVALRRRSRQ